MSQDLGVLLGSALRDIRLRTTKTQDRWQEKTGMSQSHLSAAERGSSGWESVRTIAEAVEKAGVDPIELLRLALAKGDASDEQQELLSLWGQLDKVSRDGLLNFLKSQVAARAAAR